MGLGSIGFSPCAFLEDQKKAHRLKSLCDNSKFSKQAAKTALIMLPLRHG